MRLVSAIMPSRNDLALAKRALDSFAAQTYPARELVIVRQPGSSREEDEAFTRYAMELGPRVVIEAMPAGISVGELRNIAIRAARGSLIAHWDDDDWSHPQRLELQVKREEQAPGRLIGSSKVYYVDDDSGVGYLFDGTAFPETYIVGGTWLYDRSVFTRFRDTNIGEDTAALVGLRGTRRLDWTRSTDDVIDDMQEPSLYVATIHPKNTSKKQTGQSDRWLPADYNSIKALMQSALGGK